MKKLFAVIISCMLLSSCPAYSAVYIDNNNVYATLDCIKVINITTQKSYYLNELTIKDQNWLMKRCNKTFNNGKCINVTQTQKELQKMGLDIAVISYDIKKTGTATTIQPAKAEAMIDKDSAFTKTMNVLDNTERFLNKVEIILGL